VGVLFGLELTLNPFSHHPTFRTIKDLPLEAKVAALSAPEFRARLLAEGSQAGPGFAAQQTQNWRNMFLMEANPDYEQGPDRTIAALAAARGVEPSVLALDHMLSNHGRGMLYLPFLNYAEGSLDPSFAMLNHPDTVPGLSDGGAHVGMICDGSFPTSNLTHWTRDRTRGPKISVERMVKAQTWDTAQAVGLHDRGLIAPGYRADINVIDYDGLALLAPEVAYDLPAGGRRLVQRARGYVATLVAGETTYEDGEPTGRLPGRLLRGARSAPSALAAE
jgi:N-acyl-D-aspartate/D-glutamate deacylase